MPPPRLCAPCVLLQERSGIEMGMLLLPRGPVLANLASFEYLVAVCLT